MTAESSGYASEEIREWLAGLRGLDLTDAEVEAAARRLADGGKGALPVVLELFRQEDETLLAVATQALKAWGEPYPLGPLLELLRQPEVDALAKGLILMVLERYGLDIHDSQVLGVGIDLEAAGRKSGANGNGGEEDE